jgi:hypothetical protein
MTTLGLTFQPWPRFFDALAPVPVVAIPPLPFAPLKFSGLIDLVFARQDKYFPGYCQCIELLLCLCYSNTQGIPNLFFSLQSVFDGEIVALDLRIGNRGLNFVTLGIMS